MQLSHRYRVDIDQFASVCSENVFIPPSKQVKQLSITRRHACLRSIPGVNKASNQNPWWSVRMSKEERWQAQRRAVSGGETVPPNLRRSDFSSRENKTNRPQTTSYLWIHSFSLRRPSGEIEYHRSRRPPPPADEIQARA